MTGFLYEIQVKASLEVFVISGDALFSQLNLECCFSRALMLVEVLRAGWG